MAQDIDIPFQDENGPYTILAHETDESMSHQVLEYGNPVAEFVHRYGKEKAEEESHFSYIKALDFVAEKLVNDYPESINLKEYQMIYYAPENQALTVWLKYSPEEISKMTGESLLSDKMLEDVYNKYCLPTVEVDKEYKENSRTHISADKFCEEYDSFGKEVLTSPKEALLSSMQLDKEREFNHAL